jgi:late competence protein required for DNA uptake (superfamily II DNA/RNA helicase)
MSKKAFDKIAAGLNEALEIARGNAEPVMRCRRCGNTDRAQFEKHGLGGWRCVQCGRFRMEAVAQ